MALTSAFGAVVVPPPSVHAGAAGTPTLTSKVINAGTDMIAMLVQAPKTGTLDKFECLISAIGNSPDNGIRFSFQNADATTGFPDGVQDQYRDIAAGSLSATWTAPGLMTSDGTDVGAKRSVTKGDWIWCVVEFVSFVASDSVTIGALNSAAGDNPLIRTLGNASTGTYANDSDNGIVALKYDDGTYGGAQWPSVPTTGFAAYGAYDTADSPDERALRFQVPVPCRLTGAWARLDMDGPMDLVLYDAASSVLTSISLDPDYRVSANGFNSGRIMFPSSIDLAANTTYRLALKPTDGAATVILYYFTVSANELLQAVPGGVEWYSSSRTDAGAWTDVTTERPLIGLYFDAFDNGVVAGGLMRHPGMDGGLV